jgi:hypothetical protein
VTGAVLGTSTVGFLAWRPFPLLGDAGDASALWVGAGVLSVVLAVELVLLFGPWNRS